MPLLIHCDYHVGHYCLLQVCVECKENYCQVCYATMHHKGAMAQHHVRPILNKVKHYGMPYQDCLLECTRLKNSGKLLNYFNFKFTWREAGEHVT